MFATPVSAWLQRRGIHYGWIVAAITFLTMLTMSAALGLPGAMLQPLGKEFGWSTEQISSSLALRFALFGLMGPFAAVLMERYGLRAVVCTGLALVGLGMALVTMASQLWQLFVLWSLMLGLGTGMTALVLGAVVANRWFVARRGLVVGMLTASSATGQLAFLPLAAWMIEHWGWRSAVAPIVVGTILIGLLALLLMRNRPSDVGLLPYGEKPGTQPAAPAAAAPAMNFATPFRVLKEVSTNRTFWVLAGTFFICGLSTNGLVQTHFISLCGDYGMGAVPAASVLAMMGAFDFVGTILSGWLSDRYDNRKLLFWYYGLRGLSLIYLPYAFGFEFFGLPVFAIFYGLDWIATVPPTVRLTNDVFGKAAAPIVFGWIVAGHQLGAAFATLGAGMMRASLGNYTLASMISGGLCVAGAFLVLRIHRTPKQDAERAAQPATA